MTDSTSEKSSDQSLNDREVELDLLQRRLHNKTQRVARVIQFNIVALTLVAGIAQFGEAPQMRLNRLIVTGGVIMLISIFLAVAGISLNGAPLSWIKKEPSVRLDATSLISEYRSRNRYLGVIMPAALGTGGLGAGIILMGTFRLVEIDPVVGWWVSGPIVFIVLIGGGLLGYQLAQSNTK